jgi:hypothetical protein
MASRRAEERQIGGDSRPVPSCSGRAPPSPGGTGRERRTSIYLLERILGTSNEYIFTEAYFVYMDISYTYCVYSLHP